jgi:uncharacterized protein YdhG (YjbR/CyaY superfamily)
MAKKENENVDEFLAKHTHPLKNEIEILRQIIKGTDKSILERIKWNAPSYYSKEDFLTFNLRDEKRIHLVFHHPSIEKINSALLEGDYKGRRMTYFKGMEEIKAGAAELKRVIKQILGQIK